MNEVKNMTFEELEKFFHRNSYLNNTVVYKELLAQLKLNHYRLKAVGSISG